MKAPCGIISELPDVVWREEHRVLKMGSINNIPAAGPGAWGDAPAHSELQGELSTCSLSQMIIIYPGSICAPKMF